ARMRFYRVTRAQLDAARAQLDAARARFLDTPLRCLACAALEADGFAAIAAEDLDAVVVPLVAFDDDGNRLGYGGGNYDRLLPALRDDAVIAGIAFEEQRVEAVPVEPHDRPLPHIVAA
ncbi:5-formyltetrahydrofolate cyclo-ligase, partial [Eggerthella sinensis]|uniref:5-formyltetrahydrofolate cyclo-ligase n=1 Tax=Eggerthella sinensis TaxID=242230 RepID=UPI002FD802BA